MTRGKSDPVETSANLVRSLNAEAKYRLTRQAKHIRSLRHRMESASYQHHDTNTNIALRSTAKMSILSQRQAIFEKARPCIAKHRIKARFPCGLVRIFHHQQSVYFVVQDFPLARGKVKRQCCSRRHVKVVYPSS